MPNPNTYPKNTLVLDLTDWIDGLRKINIGRAEWAAKEKEHIKWERNEYSRPSADNQSAYNNASNIVSNYYDYDRKQEAYERACGVCDEVCLTSSSSKALSNYIKEINKGIDKCEKCDILKMSSEPNVSGLEELEMKTNAAYVRVNRENVDKLFYVNKVTKECKEINFNAQEKVEKLKKFDDFITNKSTLKKEQLEDLSQIINHNRKNAEERIIKNELVRKYNYISDFLKKITPPAQKEYFTTEKNFPSSFEGVNRGTSINYLYATDKEAELPEIPNNGTNEKIRVMELNGNEIKRTKIVERNPLGKPNENPNTIPIMDIRPGAFHNRRGGYHDEKVREEFKHQIADILAAEPVHEPVLNEIFRALQNMQKAEIDAAIKAQEKGNYKKGEIYLQREQMINKTLKEVSQKLNEKAGAITYKETALLLRELKKDLPFPSRNPLGKYFGHIISPEKTGRNEINNLMKETRLDQVVESARKLRR